MTPRIVLVGASGYGRRHLEELLVFQQQGEVALVGVVDVRPPDDLDTLAGAPAFDSDLSVVLAREAVDAVVVATPPHTHAALASLVLRAGASLYLEKPPVPTIAELHRLSRLAQGRRFEIGFQQTPGVVLMVEATRATLGPVRRVTGYGALQRPDAYFRRSAWAGHRTLDGVAVGDGSLLNPLAHATHAALVVAALVSVGWMPKQIEVELGSVRDIEADDVAAFRVTSSTGPVVTAVGTTAADRVIEPGILVEGERATLRIRLRDLAATIDGRPVAPGAHVPTLRAAVLDPRGEGDPWLSASAAESFVRVVEAAARVPATTSLSRSGAATDRDGDRWVTLPGIADAIDEAVASGRTLSESGVPLTSHRILPERPAVALYDESGVPTEGVRA